MLPFEVNNTCLSRVHLALATSVVPQVSSREEWELATQLSSLTFFPKGEAGSVFSAVMLSAESLSMFPLETVVKTKTASEFAVRGAFTVIDSDVGVQKYLLSVLYINVEVITNMA